MTAELQRRDFVRALGEHGLADWVIVEHDGLIGTAEHGGLERSEKRLYWIVTVHHDAPAGRGSAHVVIDAAAGDAEAAIREAVTLARASIGPAWVTQPAAAPAHVDIADASLAARAPVAVAADILRATPAATSVRVLRETVSISSRQGLRTEWTATELRADLLVTAGDRSLRVVREARLLRALGLDDATRAAAADLALLPRSVGLAPGPCRLVLRADAMLHGGLGVWEVLVPQADAVVERQGLTRYREHMPIAEGADTVAEPLTVISDGALDHGLYSAPLGDEGEAVRRFPLVERGVAAGLALTPREAALRGRDPNGGVRNLVVSTGTWTGTAEGGRVVEVRQLRSLRFDPYTGDASLEIALAIDHDGKGASTPTWGGAVRIDLIAALASARRSATRIVRCAYAGPDAIVIDGAEIVA